MADGGTSQAKGPDHAAMRTEAAAYDLLNDIQRPRSRNRCGKPAAVVHSYGGDLRT